MTERFASNRAEGAGRGRSEDMAIMKESRRLWQSLS
jgi:hypothetical protein